MHVSVKLQEGLKTGRPTISFEFFPPKTAQGVQNLYGRMDTMHALGPSFIDVTWGAGGQSSQLTGEMVKVAQTVYGLETCMHLTCTDMALSDIDKALDEAYHSGCTNILALRGDPPRDQEKWQANEHGFRYAKDLVLHIRKRYGNHFDIGVAGYSEGCDDNTDVDQLVDHLKEKVDAGATFVISQMFYDTTIFLDWVRKCRARGITVPILPGIMPISTYAAFIRRANWAKIHVPQSWHDALEPVKNDDAAVRKIGLELVCQMCRELLDSGLIHHLHFYTMNLAQTTQMILEELSLLPGHESPIEKPLPWRQSLGLKRRDENVRPIFWRNRNRSYVMRTQDWDEFPNGRWGDSRSPAFGELDVYGLGLKGTNEQNIQLWGEPTSVKDVSDIFVKYMQGNLVSLPWSEAPISREADPIKDSLIELNRCGILTINSQPPVNGCKSSDPVFGWGPRNGYVYQKAYLELFVPASLVSQLVDRIDTYGSSLTYFAVNKAGVLSTNASSDGPNAVTWGVFPGKEILQPTIVERVSFLAWKDEFFRLAQDWANCYPAGSPSRALIQQMTDSWCLVNIVHNDFCDKAGIFPIFKDLKVTDLAGTTVTAEVEAAIEELAEKTAEIGINGPVPVQAN